MGQSRRGKGKKSHAPLTKEQEKPNTMKGKCGAFEPNVLACGFCTSPLMRGIRGKRGTKSCFKEPGGTGK